MTDKITKLHASKRGVAVLATCIVQTLNETDETFQARLERAHNELRDGHVDWDGDMLEEIALLNWTRELITGFSLGKGQENPFLAD